MNYIKRCPKCKSNVRIIKRDDFWQIICLNCDFETEKFESKRLLTLQWKESSSFKK